MNRLGLAFPRFCRRESLGNLVVAADVPNGKPAPDIFIEVNMPYIKLVIYINVYVYVYTYIIYIYICVCICIYIYIYIYI